MTIRVQPAEIEIPKDNPFRPDSLGRKPSIKALTTTVGIIDGPAVMAVDASWGMGKTTFLRMWAQHLRNEGFPVVEFNAWETDFTWDPFFALWSELSAQLPVQDDDDSPGRLPMLARKLLPFLRSGARGAAVGLALGGDPDLAAAATGISGTLGDLQGIANEPDAEHGPEKQTPFLEATYLEAKTVLQEFSLTLRESAESLSEANDNRPLVVLIDELDRCRPTYAIELLETTKHLFSVDNVVFVLCLDRQQLTHSIKAVYGNGFDADGYLRRFFDFDYRLPGPDRSKFVKSMLDSQGISKHLKGSRFIRHSDPFDSERLHAILDQDNLSLRDLQQMVHRLAIILSTASPDREIHADMLALLLALRTVDPNLYTRTSSGNATDEEVIKALSQADLSQKSHGAAIEALASACVGHCAYLANGELGWTELPHAMKRLADYNDKYANRYLRQDSSYGSSQQQSDQTQSAEHIGQAFQQQRVEMKSMEYLSDFVNHLDNFFSMHTNEKLSLRRTKYTRITSNCLELLELFPDAAAT